MTGTPYCPVIVTMRFSPALSFATSTSVNLTPFSAKYLFAYVQYGQVAVVKIVTRFCSAMGHLRCVGRTVRPRAEGLANPPGGRQPMLIVV